MEPNAPPCPVCDYHEVEIHLYGGAECPNCGTEFEIGPGGRLTPHDNSIEEMSKTWPDTIPWHTSADELTKSAEALLVALGTEGGFSVDMDLVPCSDLLYVCSIRGSERTIPENIISVDDILSFRAEHLDPLASGMIFGAWVDSGLVYFDLSKNFNTLSDAMAAAVENDQQAIWDNVEKFVVPVANQRAVVAAMGDNGWIASPEFSQFFNDATGGQYAPSQAPQWSFQKPEHQAFHDEFLNHTGNFDQHIETSIPDYRGLMTRKAVAISKAFGPQATVIDLMGGEGSWGKALTATGGNPTTTLDANTDMHNFFNQHSTVPGARRINEAFGQGYSDGGTTYPAHQGSELYDVVNESMGFQFISADRLGQINQAKTMLKPGGLFMTDEKVVTPNFKENEATKDEWKAQFYSPEQLAQKQQVVNIAGEPATGMMANMVSVEQLEQVLHGLFKSVQRYWDQGNFLGYACSDNPQTVQKFLAAYDGSDVPSTQVSQWKAA